VCLVDDVMVCIWSVSDPILTGQDVKDGAWSLVVRRSWTSGTRQIVLGGAAFKEPFLTPPTLEAKDYCRLPKEHNMVESA
jgi:hypothetical protein